MSGHSSGRRQFAAGGTGARPLRTDGGGSGGADPPRELQRPLPGLLAAEDRASYADAHGLDLREDVRPDAARSGSPAEGSESDGVHASEASEGSPEERSESGGGVLVVVELAPDAPLPEQHLAAVASRYADHATAVVAVDGLVSLAEHPDVAAVRAPAEAHEL